MEEDIPITKQNWKEAINNGHVSFAKDMKPGEILLHKPIKKNERVSDKDVNIKGSDYPLHRSEEPMITLRKKANIPEKRKLYLFKRCRSFEVSLREMGLWEEAKEFEREELRKLSLKKKSK